MTAQLTSLRYRASENTEARQDATSLDRHMQSRVLLNRSSLAVSPLGQFTEAVLRWTARPLGPPVSHICFQAELRTDTQWACTPGSMYFLSWVYLPASMWLFGVCEEGKGWRPREGRGGSGSVLGELVTVWCIKHIQKPKETPHPPIHLCRISLLVTVI